jgi:hypothetical protein
MKRLLKKPHHKKPEARRTTQLGDAGWLRDVQVQEAILIIRIVPAWQVN